jgi:hypothetical protein
MDALFALACTLPPSAAFVLGAHVWLQRERDRRVNDAHINAISEHGYILKSLGTTQDAAIEEQNKLSKRMADAEQQISRLTDRLHG